MQGSLVGLGETFQLRATFGGGGFQLQLGKTVALQGLVGIRVIGVGEAVVHIDHFALQQLLAQELHELFLAAEVAQGDGAHVVAVGDDRIGTLDAGAKRGILGLERLGGLAAARMAGEKFGNVQAVFANGGLAAAFVEGVVQHEQLGNVVVFRQFVQQRADVPVVGDEEVGVAVELVQACAGLGGRGSVKLG